MAIGKERGIGDSVSRNGGPGIGLPWNMKNDINEGSVQEFLVLGSF